MHYSTLLQSSKFSLPLDFFLSAHDETEAWFQGACRIHFSLLLPTEEEQLCVDGFMLSERFPRKANSSASCWSWVPDRTNGKEQGRGASPADSTRYRMKSVLCLLSGQTLRSGYRHSTEFVFISSVDVLAYFTLRSKKEWKGSYWRGSLGLSRGYRIGNLSVFFSPYNSVWFNQHSVTVQNLN